ncbi:PIG-L deacetylase family protein [Rhizosaccharibacter radicis]|uniref:PIG-L family deacetylase n=1 Tax=Rhizosaccharibacter radicis TaxID=2782605 RepID=A0ABT1VVL8_9PROT|nr:PIG-L family deacetylase [Acetobacteraceae bacterium KSS12]
MIPVSPSPDGFLTAAGARRLLETLPLRPLDALMPGRVLILAPHPDDESLGCGGLIAALCKAGRPPIVVVATDGGASHAPTREWPRERLCRQRRAEVGRATALLGLPADRLLFLDLPDTAAPVQGPLFDAAAARVATLMTDSGCDTLLATWRHDPHCDHLATWHLAEAVASATGVRLLAYPIWGWLLPSEAVLEGTTGLTGARLDVSGWLPRKRLAIAAHESQYGALLHDDPDGFQLPSALLSVFERPFECFLDAPG